MVTAAAAFTQNSPRLPSGTPTTEFPEMMRHLLEERFQVKMRREKKDFPVYVLEVAKGELKMRESAPDPNAVDLKAPVSISGGGSAQGISVNLGRGSSYTFANNRFEAKKVTRLPRLGSRNASWTVPLST